MQSKLGRKIVCLTLLTIGILAETGWTKNRPNDSRPIISKIKLRSTDIFDFETNPFLKKVPYTWINALHIKTKDRIMSQEFLFKVGDHVDEFLLQETERNLRALPFVRAARVVKYPQRDGTVMIVVYVADSWTTQPQLNLSGNNKIDSFEIGFKEKNLLGYGKNLEYFYETDSNTNMIQRTVRYFDPRLLGSRWQFDAQHVDKSDGNINDLTVARPFFSIDSKWAFNSNYTRSVGSVKEFDDNNLTTQYDQTQENEELSAATKVGRGRKVVHHAGLRYQKENTTYSATPETTSGSDVPESEKHQYMFLDWDTATNKYIKTARLEKITRVEDVNLGWLLKLSPGGDFHFLSGGKNALQSVASLSNFAKLGDDDILSTQFDYHSRDTFDNPSDVYFKGDAKYYERSFPNQTLVLHSRLEWGEKLDPGSPVTLGRNNGLRAYENDAFVGSKSVLLNIEDRLYFIEELWQLVSIGGVLFYDTGYAWPSDDSLALHDMKGDVGMGFRFALTKSSSEMIIRLDLSYVLDRAHSGDNPWVLSFGSGQAF